MYSVIYWADYIDSDEDYAIMHVSGVTFAETYSEAAANVESYYGDDLVQVTLKFENESKVFEFDDLAEGDKYAKF